MSEHPRIKISGIICDCGSNMFTVNKIIDKNLWFDCIDCGQHFEGVNNKIE